MGYSEKTQRDVDKYIKVLVRRQPLWLKRLFDEEKIFFVVEDNGELSLGHANIDTTSAKNAARLIAKYLDKYPMKALQVLTVQ
jgi:hypothetical protein